MNYFENYSKESLVRLADDLVDSIRKACWLTDHKRPRPNLTRPTPHMISAIEQYEFYKYNPCPTCGQNRRGI